MILGASGLVGSAVYRRLLNLGVPAGQVDIPSSSELDLLSENSVANWKYGYDYIINCAARVGGILDNRDNKYEFISENLKMQQNAMKLVGKSQRLRKYVFLGSSCIYPRSFLVPIRETDFMTGPLEDTNDAYAIAKIAGIHLGKSYFSKAPHIFSAVMPCNVYGPHDSYHNKSHVIPDLIQKFTSSTSLYTDAPVTLYGTGNPLREFIYSDDLAEAIVMIATYSGDRDMSMVNVGTDFEVSISDLAYKIKDKVGSKARISFDNSFPDGTMRKKLDTSKMEDVFGWKAKTNLDEGLAKAIDWYSTFKTTEKWT